MFPLFASFTTLTSFPSFTLPLPSYVLTITFTLIHFPFYSFNYDQFPPPPSPLSLYLSIYLSIYLSFSLGYLFAQPSFIVNTHTNKTTGLNSLPLAIPLGVLLLVLSPPTLTPYISPPDPSPPPTSTSSFCYLQSLRCHVSPLPRRLKEEV